MKLGISIGELSKRVGLPAKTIRFYEEAGLAPVPKREANGYRVYGEESEEKLRIIKYARDLGLPMSEIKKLMDGCAGGNCRHSADYVKKEILQYTRILEEKINEMTELKRKLKLVEKSYGKYPSGSKYCCNILGQLSRLEGGEGK